MSKRLAYTGLFALFVLLPSATMAYKLFALDYPLSGLIPVVSHTVDIALEVDGHGEDVSLRTFLPKSDARQQIGQEISDSGLFNPTISTEGLNRTVTWAADQVSGPQVLHYTFSLQSQRVRYHIPETLLIPATYPAELHAYLIDEPGLHVNDELISAELQALLPSKTLPILDVLTRIHRHLQDGFKNKDFSGFTDALTALKLREASCNGKGRLFVAMARHLNIPARLVGGVILNPGTKRVSHQWVEAYVNGHWVPFDTINDHFAEIPANFLTLYYGDEVLFKHTASVNFNYRFTITRKLVPQQETQQALGASAMNLFNFYALFQRIGISQNLLKTILMIPLGALVTVIFRNVIGVATFGTFLPALIAAAARETGLLWGAVGFVMIVLVSAMLRQVLDWLQLLHSPKMAILLTFVVMIMLGMTVLGVNLGYFDLAHVTLFPIALLAITAERFAIIDTEQGFLSAIGITFNTLLVIAAAYAVMNSLFLQSLVLAFPETLLIVIALNLWLGKWVGMRVTEFVRFRKLIFQPLP